MFIFIEVSKKRENFVYKTVQKLYMPPYPPVHYFTPPHLTMDARHHISPYPTISHHIPPYLTASHHISPHLTIYHHIRQFIILPHYISRGHMPSYLAISHDISPHLTISRHSHLFTSSPHTTMITDNYIFPKVNDFTTQHVASSSSDTFTMMPPTSVLSCVKLQG